MGIHSPRRKRLSIAVAVLGLALIAERTLSWAGSDAAEAAEAAAPPPAQPRAEAVADSQRAGSTAVASAERIQLERLEARQQALEAAAQGQPAAMPKAALFGSVSWAPPPPPPPPPAPPPKPVAPPFPYAYMGGLTEDGVRTAFFNTGERALVVKAGDTVDGVYRVDQLSDRQMQVTYLPLDQRLAVALGTTP